MTYKINGRVTVSSTREAFLANATVSSVNASVGYLFQGSNSGYTSGGPSGGNTIDKFPFATNANATDVGDLTRTAGQAAGQSSDSFGYTSGGFTPSLTNIIDRFPFASNANASDVGDLTVARHGLAGQSSSINGYSSGGLAPPGSPSAVNTIDIFPFASNANAADVGDLTLPRQLPAGQSSATQGYTSGGYLSPPSFTGQRTNTIDSFPFATNANASDVGDITVVRDGASGQSSVDSGYSSGGGSGPAPSSVTVNTIDKFPFASNANATDVGDLTVVTTSSAGQSSYSDGYASGGFSNIIQKFPFASNANATDVGDLTVSRTTTAGQQN